MKLIDLSQTLENGMCVFPGAPAATFEKVGNVENGDSYTLTKIEMTTHVGTHVDCNSHTVAGGFHADTQDINFFMGKGIVIDCSHLEPKTEIGIDVLYKYDLSDKEFVLFHTDWAKNFGKSNYWTEFKPLSNELIAYLGSSKIVKGLGVDYGTIDPLEDAALSKHVIFFQNEKTVIENLTNLETLIGKDFTFAALPLKLKNGDGSPVRAVAIID